MLQRIAGIALTCLLISNNGLSSSAVKANDVARINGLPPIGKWMIAPDGTYAHWLGDSFEGKKLREPINIVIVDAVAKTADEARDRLTRACVQAGYPIRRGHSGGYHGFIGSKLWDQLPQQKDRAFSNEPFELTNNHGRLFGPASIDGKFWFTGSLSRERVAPLSKVKHAYVSFNQARDHFADALDQKSAYKKARFVKIDNALLGDATCTTGDHDGVGILLEAEE